VVQATFGAASREAGALLDERAAKVKREEPEEVLTTEAAAAMRTTIVHDFLVDLFVLPNSVRQRRSVANAPCRGSMLEVGLDLLVHHRSTMGVQMPL
jgi:hypothetical protein